MVIFKSISVTVIENLVLSFTFQYGDIQMANMHPQGGGGIIYIPIWWYSNGTAERFDESIQSQFTFQSGDIQIIRLIGSANLLTINLHSNLVIFK